ncbi:hypothetical protein ZEAMMB73_Zm00001d041225 [Zea mays]|uniref:Uncharacterized protein n=1 Tax=Zea mays TaxID=4577 RepID=A0A1D6MV52_MAIZE|nr:hypothetical protein ZEAMMB73_Zm00001d041225 [Zea mays]
MIKSDNRICADCGAPDPKWVSANIGVFLCLKCGDVHRALGPDISKVLSVTLDDWSDSDIDSMVEVDDYSMVSFIPLDLRKESSIQYVLSSIDTCIQYGEDADVKVRDFEEDED